MIFAIALTDAPAPPIDPGPFSDFGLDPLTADCALLYAEAPDDSAVASAFVADARNEDDQRMLLHAARTQDDAITTAFESGDVLPLRFGACFHDLAAARAAVATDAMAALWRKVCGVGEWTLNATLALPDIPEDDAPGGYLRRKAALRVAAAATEAAGVQLVAAVDAALTATAPVDWTGPTDCTGSSPQSGGRRWTIRAPRDGDWADRAEAALNAAVTDGAAPAGARFDLWGPTPPYGVTA